MPRSVILLALAALCATTSVHAHESPRRMIRRGPLPAHIRRQNNAGGAVSPTSSDTTSASTSTPAASSSTPTDDGGLLGSVLTGLDPNKNSQTVAPITVPTVTSTSTATTRSSTTSSSSSAKSINTGPTVVQVTQTSTISAASSSTSSATSLPANNGDSDSGGGIGKGTLIAIIVAASSVGLVAAVWTIFRKFKLCPSRRFEDKLNPIDFVDEYGQPANPHGVVLPGAELGGADSLRRSGSNASSEMLHKRQESWGSGSVTGSQRGAPMSETGYARAIYPPPSQAGQYYAPPSVPYAPPSQNAHNPYGDYGATARY